MKRRRKHILEEFTAHKSASSTADNFLLPIFRRPSKFPTGTLGNFADQVGAPVADLLKRLEDAGIHGVTPDHRFDKACQQVLIKKRRVLINESDYQAQKIYEADAFKSDHILLVQDINEEFLSYLSKNPEALYRLGSRKFEELVGRLFSDRGYGVSITKSTRDGGYDILAVLKDSFTSLVVLAECKRYQPHRRVGVEIVRGLYGVTEANRANQGLIITSSFFTRDAHEEQIRLGSRIALKDYDNLVEWLKPYSS